MNTAVAKTEVLDSLPVGATSETAAILSMVERAATNPAVNIDTMERLMVMHRQERDRIAHLSFTAALGQAQSEITRVIGNRKNEQTKSHYATFAKLDDAVRPTYTAHGFTVSFTTEPQDKADILRVVGKLTHRDGHCERYEIDMPADGKGAQGAAVMTRTHATGSGYTYGRRYLLIGMFNIPVAAQDDDGNAASAQLSEAEEAAVTDYFQAIAEAETSQALVKNVGQEIAKSTLGGTAKKKVRDYYTARLTTLRNLEARK